jgi:hypothetical protein
MGLAAYEMPHNSLQLKATAAVTDDGSLVNLNYRKCVLKSSSEVAEHQIGQLLIAQQHLRISVMLQ